MPEAVTCPAEHPAAQAWKRLGSERAEPERIEILKRKPKSAVYRLAGIGPGGSAVIAKRCLNSTAFTERLIYEQCLPRLPVPGLKLCGFLTEGEYCWLFVEDAEGQAYSPDDPSHRRLAGRWLGVLHAAATDEALSRRLPGRGVDHYLQVLESSRAGAIERLSNPVLFREDREILRGIADRCDCVESHWTEVEAFCRTIQPALVHGDLAVKNVYLRTLASGLALLVFDWENAGWGVPAADLCQAGGGKVISPDLAVYCATLAQRGCPLGLREAQRLAAYGRIFRVLDAIQWEAASLVFPSQECVAAPMARMRTHRQDLTQALQTLNWIE